MNFKIQFTGLSRVDAENIDADLSYRIPRGTGAEVESAISAGDRLGRFNLSLDVQAGEDFDADDRDYILRKSRLHAARSFALYGVHFDH